MLYCPAALPLSARTLSHVAGLIHRQRRQIGSAWRKLTSGLHALLVLAYLCKGEAFTELTAGFGVSIATAWGYICEAVSSLAARSPKVHHELAAAKNAGQPMW